MLKILLLCICFKQLNFVLSQEDFYNFLDVRLNDFPEKNISLKCLDETRLMRKSLQNFTLWAMEMWEATSRESPSLLKGTNYHLGNFDECMVPTKNDLQNVPMRQYCLVKINIHFVNPTNFSDKKIIFDPYESSLNVLEGNGDTSKVQRNLFYWAVCTPASCSSSDIVTMIDNHFHATSEKTKGLNISLSASLGDEFCQQDGTENGYATGVLIFIFVSCFLSAVVIAASVYHWFFDKNYMKNKKAQCPDMVKAFSIIFHLNHLNYFGNVEVGLEALNGIRVIAIIFVIAGHRVSLLTQNPMINREYQENQYQSIGGIIMRQTDISVDIFFILSGILGVYNLLKRTEKRHINYAFIILYRYLRIVPLYAFAMFFIATFLPITGNGPFWKRFMGGEASFCIENWWINLLMINNYVDVGKMCIAPSWYISCDFHYFIIAVFACFLLKKKVWTKIVLNFLGGLIAISVITTCLITYFMQVDATLKFDYKFITAPRMDLTYQITYMKSHTRIPSYIMGMFGGFILYKFFKPGEKRFSTAVSTIVGLCSIIFFLLFTLSTWKVYTTPEEIGPVVSAIFSGFHRPIKSACFFILIMFCLLGKIPIISSFLEWRPWLVLSKLTFGAYLFHMNLQLRDDAMLRQPFYFDQFVCFKMLLGDLVLVFSMSLLFYLTVEGPSNQIIRAFIMSHDKKSGKEITKKCIEDQLELEKFNVPCISNSSQ